MIDASSIQSIVQNAGRVNRHRLNAVKNPNIVIPQFNYKYCENQDRPQPKKIAVFTQPGYEGYKGENNRYKSQDLKQLLPWSESTQSLVIDARLRFDAPQCKLAQYDDEQIQKYSRDFFASKGDQLFSHQDSDAALMTEQIYKDTCLRDMQKQEVYSFDLEDDELNIYHYLNDALELDVQTGHYKPATKKVVLKFEDAPENAWLSLDPEALTALCLEKDIPIKEGCKLSLAVYGDDIPQWCYHFGFGVSRVKLKSIGNDDFR